MKHYQKNNGFTLIELLVVVLIIGILAAVALPQYQKAVDRTRLTEALILGKHIRDAEKIYFLANNSYTNKYEELSMDMPSGAVLTAENKIRVKKFTYSLTLENSPRVVAEALVGGVALLFHFSGVTRCYAYEDSDWRGIGMCKLLGAAGDGKTGHCGENRSCKYWDLP